MSEDIRHYLALPYKLEVTPLTEEDGGGYYARYVEFGSSAHGDGATVTEAVESAREGLQAVLEVMLEHGDRIPEPLSRKRRITAASSTCAYPGVCTRLWSRKPKRKASASTC